ncbi:dTDP-4-dehydrorhamnose 3,5-epimerase [Planctomycetales bacterium]|nr:dTDP-4-dehydrorhamnose 3,5-epimerase [Planctomycetales bacterium]
MKFTPLPLPDTFLIETEPRSDDRGCFTRLFCAKELQQINFHKPLVQINEVFSKQKGTLRGLHYQKPPHSEAKIIKCLLGAVQDVIVDVRKDSPTFLKWFSTELSPENDTMLFVPEGFAHGYLTLQDNTAVLYMVSEFYAPESETGIRYNDPLLNIEWKAEPAVISEKDRNYPYL